MSNTNMLLFILAVFLSGGLTSVIFASKSFDRRFGTDRHGIPKAKAPHAGEPIA